jgi:hypothetical protein
MKSLGFRLAIVAAAVAAPFAAAGTAQADALPTPAMAGPLAANASPFSIDLPDWLGDAGGKVYVGGAVTGLAYWQSNPTFGALGDNASLIDLDNGQVFIQKTDGWLQFYAQIGGYSLPTVGVPYTKTSAATPNNFGYVPVAYLKIQGQGNMSNWSLEGGKLPTLIGDEYTFTFENMNIERGLLWNLEPAVSTGVQLNYADGPLTVSLSVNDGTYAKEWNWLSGLISYGFNSGADTVAIAGGGNLGKGNFSFLNSGSVVDLIYTHTSGPWVISPYLQYNSTPHVFFAKGSTVFGGALLVSYAFDDNWKLAGRVEYESESGHKGVFTTPDIIGYGPGSNAWSLTATPTYQWKQFFGRLDLSYVTVGSGTPGLLFGTPHIKTDQVRLMFETGVLL